METPTCYLHGLPAHGSLSQAVRDHVQALGYALVADPAQAAVTVASLQHPAPSSHARLIYATETPPTASDWARALRDGASAVVRLPQDSALFLTALREAASAPAKRSPLVAIASGHGGAGASSFAARLAGAAGAKNVTSALIDLDPCGGYLDTLTASGNVPGLRWPEIGSLAGEDPAALLAALPLVDGVRILTGPLPPDAAVRESAVSALRSVCDLVVADCNLACPPACLSDAYPLLLVTGDAPNQVAASALRCRELHREGYRAGIVLRRSRLGLPAAEVAKDCGFPVCAEFRNNRRALVPLLDVSRRRTGADAACRSLLAELGSVHGGF
ncbi:hypothetical protein ACUH90_06660 [Dermabacteraceae bacterium P7054]